MGLFTRLAGSSMNAAGSLAVYIPNERSAKFVTGWWQRDAIGNGCSTRATNRLAERVLLAAAEIAEK